MSRSLHPLYFPLLADKYITIHEFITFIIMKKLILLLLLIPILSFCQVTTFNEIDNINGIQDFQRTLIEKGYSFYDPSQFFGTEREADKWKVYVFDPSSYYMAGMGIDLYTAFGQ